VDSHGLVVGSRAGLSGHKLRYAHAGQGLIADFLTAIKTLKPTAIIGVAAVGGAFTPEVLRTMVELNERPIIFALSNPTSKAECSAEQAYRHTDGRALFACGSPYEPVEVNGMRFVPRQGNNSYIFPGVGLGAIASRARVVTDAMFMAAAHTLADCVDQADLNQGSLYPALPRIREVSARIAAAVAGIAYQTELGEGPAPNDLIGYVRAQMYEPSY
jgi:malate dehydrogenase (oxaloacetate-decarboxylating)(NADP+)